MAQASSRVKGSGTSSAPGYTSTGKAVTKSKGGVSGKAGTSSANAIKGGSKPQGLAQGGGSRRGK